MKKAVSYARFSSDNQRSESIDAQMYDINEWAENNGYQVVKMYADEAKSGTEDQRDGFLQMIADLKSDRLDDIDIVLVHKSDRFARNRWDSAIKKKLWIARLKYLMLRCLC